MGEMGKDDKAKGTRTNLFSNERKLNHSLGRRTNANNTFLLRKNTNERENIFFQQVNTNEH